MIDITRDDYDWLLTPSLSVPKEKRVVFWITTDEYRDPDPSFEESVKELNIRTELYDSCI